jgi:hypothetical protein
MKLKVEIRNGEDIFFATRVDAKSGMWRLACFYYQVNGKINWWDNLNFMRALYIEKIPFDNEA